MISEGFVKLIHDQIRTRPTIDIIGPPVIGMSPVVLDVLRDFAKSGHRINTTSSYKITLNTTHSDVSNTAIVCKNETIEFTGCIVSDVYFHGTGKLVFKKCIIENTNFNGFTGSVSVSDCLAMYISASLSSSFTVSSSIGVGVHSEGSKFSEPIDLYPLNRHIVLRHIGEDEWDGHSPIHGVSIRGKPIVLTLESRNINLSYLKKCEILVPKHIKKVIINGSVFDDTKIIHYARCVIETINVYSIDRVSRTVSEINVTMSGDSELGENSIIVTDLNHVRSARSIE